jgi:hypothetical protein
MSLNDPNTLPFKEKLSEKEMSGAGEDIKSK